MTDSVLAILRGVRPHEVVGVGDVLIENGIRQIEIPLMSPDALECISLLAEKYAKEAVIGAGTVLNVGDVSRVAIAGGNLISTPGCSSAIIAAAKVAGLQVCASVMTASECRNALAARVDAVKIYPAFLLGADGVQALRSMIAEPVKAFAVGGIEIRDIQAWIRAGVDGFGIDSSLYRPGLDISEINRRASQLAALFEEAGAGAVAV